MLDILTVIENQKYLFQTSFDLNVKSKRPDDLKNAVTDALTDAVTFCSVLFLLEENIKANLMSEAIRVLKPMGKIVILTPSGRKPIISSFIEVWKYRFSINNYTFPIWKLATTGVAEDGKGKSGRKNLPMKIN